MRRKKSLDVKSVILKLFSESFEKVYVKEITGEKFYTVIDRLETAFGFHSYNNSINSTFTAITSGRTDILKQLPAIDNLFSIKKVGSNFGISENFRLDFRFNDSNRRDIIFKLDTSKILEIRVDKITPIYFIVNNLTFVQIERLLKEKKVIEIVNRALFNEKPVYKEPEEDLIVKIDSSNEFTTGRFFLPGIVSVKPEVTTTQFTNLRISRNNEWSEQWNGLCYEISFTVGEQNISLYYLFDLIDRDNVKEFSGIFYKLLKIIFRSNIKNLKECGVILERISAKIVDKPSNKVLEDYIDLRYYLKSPGYMAPGRIIIPNDYISLILHKIAPPWSIFYTEDTLLTRLKSFMALNRELNSQGLLPVIEVENSRSVNYSTNPVTNLKLNFTKLNYITDALGKSESSKLISNYFYPKGWSAAMLKKLFYYSPERFIDEPAEVYPLPLFNEDKFITYLMKNMKDEWIHNKSIRFDNYKKLSKNHFKILKELYNEEKLEKSVKLQTILNESFTLYYEKIDKIFNEISSDLSYIKLVDQEEVKGYLYNHLAVKRVFYYIPGHLKLFNEIITPDNLIKINELQIENPPGLDDWLEDFIEFRRRITTKRTI